MKVSLGLEAISRARACLHARDRAFPRRRNDRAIFARSRDDPHRRVRIDRWRRAQSSLAGTIYRGSGINQVLKDDRFKSNIAIRIRLIYYDDLNETRARSRLELASHLLQR